MIVNRLAFFCLLLCTTSALRGHSAKKQQKRGLKEKTSSPTLSPTLAPTGKRQFWDNQKDKKDDDDEPWKDQVEDDSDDEIAGDEDLAPGEMDESTLQPVEETMEPVEETDPPTPEPTEEPTSSPTTGAPTPYPTLSPTDGPSGGPTNFPTYAPTDMPSVPPTIAPTASPSILPTLLTSMVPSGAPSEIPAVPLPDITLRMALETRLSVLNSKLLTAEMKSFLLAYFEDYGRGFESLDVGLALQSAELVTVYGTAYFRSRNPPTQEEVAEQFSVFFSFWGTADLKRKLVNAGLPIVDLQVEVNDVDIDSLQRQGDKHQGDSNDGLLILLLITVPTVLLLCCSVCVGTWLCRRLRRQSPMTARQMHMKTKAAKSVMSFTSGSDDNPFEITVVGTDSKEDSSSEPPCSSSEDDPSEVSSNGDAQSDLHSAMASSLRSVDQDSIFSYDVRF